MPPVGSTGKRLSYNIATKSAKPAVNGMDLTGPD